MTLHAPQSSARLLSIIARRMIFRRSTLVAVGAIASTSVVFAARDGQQDFKAQSLYTPLPSLSLFSEPGFHRPGIGASDRTGAMAGLAVPSTLEGPKQGDQFVAPEAAYDSFAASIGRPGPAPTAPSADAEPDEIADDTASLTSPNPVKLASLEPPTPDWGTLNSVLSPRFPDLGPLPLVPPVPALNAGDAVPEIDDAETGPRLRTYSAAEDETLEDLLIRAGVGEEDRRATLIAFRADAVDGGIGSEDHIDLAFDRDDNRLLGIRMRLADKMPLELRWDGKTGPLWASLTLSDDEALPTIPLADTDIIAETAPTAAQTIPIANSENSALITGEIKSSLWGAADKAGLRPSDAKRMADLFRYIVDFERDLRKGDRFEALFERKADGTYGDILYAKLTNRGSDIALYLGQDEYGDRGYFDVSGKTNLRTIMRTPLAGARVSSKFGMRRHPILGYDKMHRGVDFTAPRGTPIYAAGNGVLDYVGRRGSYGKYIRIRHNGTFKTAYAHMSRYAAGMTIGKRVRQGEVIGYVGSTGRSTGPHLHFEIIQDGARVNPMQVADFGPEKVLSGSALSSFKANVAKVEVAIGLLRSSRYAQAR